ncbi:MAG: BACON domain-containing protein [Planctomycetes bacterium]|nr:BACON domain-containing protein [Planctomycetota bacterium]
MRNPTGAKASAPEPRPRARRPGRSFGGALFLQALLLAGCSRSRDTHGIAVSSEDISFGDSTSTSTFEVWTEGSGRLEYAITVEPGGGPEGWISVSPTAGTTTGEHDPIEVTVDRSLLPPGNHAAEVVVSAGPNSQTLSVSVDVVGIATSASAHIFTAGDLPLDLLVWNAGTGSLQFEVEAPPWLLVTGNTGPSLGLSDPETLTLTPSPGALPPSTREGVVVLSPLPAQGTNGASVAVTLVVPPGEAAQEGPPPNEQSPLGINLSGVTYFSPELVFVDVFRQSRPFSESGTFPLLPTGYPASLGPGEVAWTLRCSGLQGHYPAGTYHCFYEGSGTLEFQFDAQVASAREGHAVLDVTPTDAGIGLQITATDPADRIRNVRLLLPGFEAGGPQVFHPAFLARWDTAKVLRFMGWQGTNDSAQVDWPDRALPSLQTQGGPKGVALEHMIALANRLKADPWFCMPHQATDAYVAQFATLVRDHLDPDLKVHVEYSNETWNSVFDQTDWCRQQGLALGLGPDPFFAGLRFYSQRAVQVFGIWSAVFGSNDRLVRVLGGQNANPAAGAEVMDWQGASASADALAVAPYFGNDLGGPAICEETAALTVPALLAACQSHLAVVFDDVLANQANAAARGLDLLGYEGGQHLSGFGGCETSGPLNLLFDLANRDPGMYLLYLQLLDGWRTLGGKTLVAFASMSRYTQFGRWGLLEWHDQDPATAPKYVAFEDFIAANPIWW